MYEKNACKTGCAGISVFAAACPLFIHSLTRYFLSEIGTASFLIFLYEADVFMSRFFIGQDRSVVLIAHLIPHELGHAFAHDDAAAIFFHDLFM